MVSNIDIFQGIVSKLEIPVSWQHYYRVYARVHTVNRVDFFLLIMQLIAQPYSVI